MEMLPPRFTREHALSVVSAVVALHQTASGMHVDRWRLER